MLALWGFLITGIWVGLITFEVNINRVNIIFYPVILLCAYGISLVVDKFGKLFPVIVAAYAVSSVLFSQRILQSMRKRADTITTGIS